jgi:EAL domain-containing protein (putative c-di-GMP-specific phosphodiesterase class I)
MPTRPQATRRAPENDVPPPTDGDALAAAPPLKFTPVAHMVGHNADDVRMLSAIMDGIGVEHKAFENSAALIRAWSRRVPDMIILGVSAGGGDAVDTIFALAEQKYTGALQLTCDHGNATIEAIARVAQRHALNCLPAVSKPFDKDALTKLFDEQKSTALQSGPSKIRLDEGLKNNWIDFWYQPKLDLRTRSPVGVESFVRLFHPQIGLVPPSVFLQDANETSLFILGQRALVHAVKTASNFAELGLNLTVAINVSVKALRTLPVSRIIQTNHPHKSKPLQLTFDVNESDVAADPSFFAQRVKLLRTLGVSLAIDDFQSDRLSQTDLKNMAPAELKIPRMFVAGCDGKSVEAKICQSIIDVAHKLAARAVAIGIERAPQVAALEEMGCDVGQGFLFGQSMPNDQIVRLMRQRSAPK